MAQSHIVMLPWHSLDVIILYEMNFCSTVIVTKVKTKIEISHCTNVASNIISFEIFTVNIGKSKKYEECLVNNTDSLVLMTLEKRYLMKWS